MGPTGSRAELRGVRPSRRCGAGFEVLDHPSLWCGRSEEGGFELELLPSASGRGGQHGGALGGAHLWPSGGA